MTTEQVLAFLDALRVKNVFVKDNGWVVGSCPLAKWLHKHHVNQSPSFALSVNPGSRSHFLCFACRQGSAEELLHSIEMYSHNSKDYDFVRCHQLLSEEQFVLPLPAYGEFHHPVQIFTEWPQYWLDSFQKVGWVDDAYKYLTHRGVNQTTMEQFDLRWDTKRRMVVAPYRDVFNRLAGARGRAIDDDVKQKHYDYSFQNQNNARLVWFNEQVLNLPGAVVVVEGQFDTMKTVQAYPKVVAALSSKPPLEKMKKLGDCVTVIQIPDRDDAGEQSITVYAKFCRQLGLTHKVLWLDEGAKDPDDCAVEYLRDRIQSLL